MKKENHVKKYNHAKRHICPNKLFYSYYSVLFTGAAFVLLMYLAYTYTLSNVMIFPVFMCIITCVVGMFVLLSNQALILHEKFKPTRLMGLVIIVGAGILLWITLVIPYRFFEFIVYYGNVMFFGFLIMSFLSVKRKPCYGMDFVIILGCSISKNGHLLPLLKARVNRAIHFAWEQEIDTEKPAWYIPSGGKGADEIMSEGSAMEFYLLSHGAEEVEVFPEKNSKNTQENFAFSKKIIDAIMKDAKVSYCTTNFHVFRSGILAQRAGIDAQGISSTTKWYFWPNALIREFVGFLTLFPIHHVVMIALVVGMSFVM